MRTSLAILVLALAGCELTQEHPLFMLDKQIDPPDAKQIEDWKKFDPWRADPRRVAHEELGRRLEVPWRGQAYTAERYQFVEKNAEHPEWGSYVVRGYRDATERVWRYRVKVDCDDGIWYATELSHFIVTTLDNPILDDNRPPPMGK